MAGLAETQQMKRFRLPMLSIAVAIVAAGLLLWARRSTTEAAVTPEECLDTYYNALRSGDRDKYSGCVVESHGIQSGGDRFQVLCREANDLKNLVQVAGPRDDEALRWIDVDEVRASGIRRLRYHLRRDERGWLIVGIETARERAAPIPFGTPAGDER